MFRKPALLADHHQLGDFDSGKPVLDTFLKHRALVNQQLGFSRCFVIATADFHVVGYHALCAGMILRQHTPRPIGGHGAPDEIPVALLARLAVDRRHQRQGLGAALLKHALSLVVAADNHVAFRAVMVHVLDAEADRFYRHYGFREAKGLERTLLLPKGDILAALDRSG